MIRPGLDRRSFLRTSSAVLIGTALSGCTSESNSSPPLEDKTDTPSPAPKQTETDNTLDKQTEDNRDTEEISEQTDDNQDPETNSELGYLHSVTGQTYPSDIDGRYHRRYEWNAIGGEWWLELSIPKALEAYYDARFRQRNHGTFVSDPYDDAYINVITGEFERLGTKYELSDREIIDLAMAFVQQLQYTPDEVATGFTQYTYYPLQTLLDHGGDCEDTAILLAAILREMGYDCVLLALWDAEHMALGVKGDPSIPGTYYEYSGNRYYYVETTGYGWRIGEMPLTIQHTQAEIQEIHRHPTLVYGWETSMNQTGEVVVNAAVGNVGQETAWNTSFYVEFEDQSERVHAQAEAFIGLLGPDDIATKTVVLQPPDDEILRVNTAVFLGGVVHDFHQSEWLHPV